MNKPPSLYSSTSDSALPAICKDMIGSAVARLRSCQLTEESESMGDKLILDLLAIYHAVRSIADLYENLDDDSQENCKHQRFLTNLNQQSHSSVSIFRSIWMHKTCDHSATQRASFCSVCVYVNSVCLQYWSPDSSSEGHVCCWKGCVHYHALGLQH